MLEYLSDWGGWRCCWILLFSNPLNSVANIIRRKILKCMYQSMYKTYTFWITDAKYSRMGYTRFWSTILYSILYWTKICKTILYSIPILYQVKSTNFKCQTAKGSNFLLKLYDKGIKARFVLNGKFY